MRHVFSLMILVMFICVTVGCYNINANTGSGNARQFLLTRSACPASEIKQVAASTSGGNIEITGDAANEASIEIYGSCGSGDSAATVAKVNEYFNIRISHDNNTLNVVAERKKSFIGIFFGNNNVFVHYKIHVSKEVACNLQTSGGDIRLAQLTGDQRIHTSGGNIDAREIQGNMGGETSGGNINLSRIDGGVTDLRTSGGNIDGDSINGTTKLETSGGNIAISDGKGSYALKTSGGNVTVHHLNGALNMRTSGGNLDATNISGGLIGATSGGEINVKFDNISAETNLDNSGGDIRLSIPKTSKVNLAIGSENVSVDGLVNFSGKYDKSSIEGTLNGGGPVIKARASGGLIRLNLE